jgi:putative transposase
MVFDPAKHHRRSIRLQGYDYSQKGMYYITICTTHRVCLFGHVKERKMWLNEAGQMVHTVWNDMSMHYLEIEIDAFVVMPNHVHAIIILVGGAASCNQSGQPQGVAPTTTTLSLADVVHRYKTLTTKLYTDGVKKNGWLPFAGKLWQRNYYENIIRNEESLNLIREYINNNPMQWRLDRDNPKRGTHGRA